MMTRRRKRNPLRDRLTPADHGSLGARKDMILGFAKQTATVLYKNRESIRQVIAEGRQLEMSWVQIRKALHKAMNILVDVSKTKER